MKIVAVSDLHGNLPEIPPCDLVLLAGDICPDRLPDRGPLARTDPSIQATWLREKFSPWWHKLQAKSLGATWGNHDFIGEKPDMKLPIDEEVELGGLRVWFSPWTPQNDLPMKWAFMRDDFLLTRRYDAIPEGIDILVTHGPPRGFGDGVPGFHDESCPLWRTMGSRDPDKCNCGCCGHVGSRTLLDAIRRVKPKLVICGHIHAAYGKYDLDGIPVYNVALVDDAYRPVNPVTEIEFPV